MVAPLFDAAIFKQFLPFEKHGRNVQCSKAAPEVGRIQHAAAKAEILPVFAEDLGQVAKHMKLNQFCSAGRHKVRVFFPAAGGGQWCAGHLLNKEDGCAVRGVIAGDGHFAKSLWNLRPAIMNRVNANQSTEKKVKLSIVSI